MGGSDGSNTVIAISHLKNSTNVVSAREPHT